MESGSIPPTPPTPPTEPGQPPETPDDPVAAAEKKFKIAAVAAGILGVAAIGFAIWAFSLNGDDKSEEQTVKADDALIVVNQKRVEEAKANYESIRNKLANRDTEDAELEEQIKKLNSEVESAKSEEENAQSADDKETAKANSLQKQLQLAQACAQAAVKSANTLTDESADDAGLSAIEGTIAKLTTVTEECQAVLN
jgi:predicted nuclease with TOPRIM domain